MRKGPDGKWRTVGGIEVTPAQARELDRHVVLPGDVVHRLFIVNPKSPVWDIVERECKIVTTEKITWAEPLMPIRGQARNQKRFMIGAFAFYTRQQAERKKLILLASLARAMGVGQAMHLAAEAQKQIRNFKETGEVK